MAKIRLNLLVKVVIAIVAGILLGFVLPAPVIRIFTTFNGLFGNFLNFVVPLIILALVAPGIADLGSGSGRILLITIALAYGFTLFSGFFTFFTCECIFPSMLSGVSMDVPEAGTVNLLPFFEVSMPPVLGVMSALILAFVLGIGMAYTKTPSLHSVMSDFRTLIEKVISGAIIPLLPIFIFGIFLKMSAEGVVGGVLKVFLAIIGIIFVLTFIVLLVQFSIAGAVGHKNPFKMLKTMLTAYLTALGTQSSAATIPVTTAQAKKMGVSNPVADFVIPLCATIHLSGSTLKIVACSMAIILMTGGSLDTLQYAGFILMLGVTMVAAPGVPGGAIMAATGILESILGFDQEAIGLMIALYIAMDSFGTACNVTGDGAIAVIVDKINSKNK